LGEKKVFEFPILAWGSRLVALELYQPYFIGAALAFFGYAFFKLYRKSKDCAPGEACAILAVRQMQRLIFWLVAIAALALTSFSLYAPLFY
jgi:mercuric ion transport protein